MSLASPNHSTPHIRHCNAASLVMQCLCVWALLLAGALAQTTTTTDASTTNTDTTSGATVTFTGSTLTLNNSAGQTGVITLAGDNLLKQADGTMTLNATSTGVSVYTGVSNVGTLSTNVNLGTLTGTGTTIGTTTDTSTDTNGLVLTGTTGSTSGLMINGALNWNTLNNVYAGGTISYGTSVSSVLSSTSLLKTGASTLSISSSGVISSGTSLLGNASGGTITLILGGTNTAADVINSMGILPASGTLVLSSGGVLNLSGISACGLTLVGSTNVTGGTTLGSTGLTLTTTGTIQSSGSVNVTTLGSVPVGNTPTSASFAAPAMALLGVGNVGSQGISERGVIYSLTSANGSPTLGGTGVVKVVHTGLPNATGGFSLTAAGLAAKTSYTYRVYATDSTGGTYLSTPSTFITPTVLQNWRQTFFGTIQGSNHAADNADPDGDGLPNLIEFATGKDPTISQTASGTGTSVNAGTLEYTYTRSLDALNSGTTFTVEWNDTLNPVQWSNTGVTEVILSDDGLLQQVKATLPASSTGHRFVRLKVLPPSGSSTTANAIGTSAP